MKRIFNTLSIIQAKGKQVMPFILKNIKKQASQIFNTIGLNIDPISAPITKTDNSFLKVCFIDDYFPQIDFLIKSKKYKNIIIAGDSPLAKKIFSFLNKYTNIKVKFADNINALASLKTSNVEKTYEKDPIKNANNFDCILLFCTKNTSTHFIKLITHSLEFQIDLILPANGNGWYKIDRNTFGKPCFVCFFPFAGTNRFSPQWNYITQKINYDIGRGFGPYLINMKHTKKRKLNTKCTLQYLDQGLKEEIKHLDYFQYASTHEWSTLKTIANNKECNIIVLMRDPRDIANSCYWHYFGNSKEILTKRVLKGFVKFNNNVLAHNFTYPSIEQITNAYVLASQSSSSFVIKFEDLISNPAIALKDLFTKLGIYPSIFCHLDENTWQEAALRGSFTYQTKGQFIEGKSNSSFYNRNTGLHRKGIAGDWKSSFSPDAVEYVKKVTKDGLIKLGYEKDMDWNL